MTPEFKHKLLNLYPNFDKVTGPYLRKDGRKHICLNNSKVPHSEPNKTKTLSWPKALVEVREGRLLLDNETADHIDEDFTNDELSNLQILTRVVNAAKSIELNEHRQTELGVYICPECCSKFVGLVRQVRANNIKQGKDGPFCSKNCSGKWTRRKQLARMVELADTTVLSTVAKA